jgi:hypothetical protein
MKISVSSNMVSRSLTWVLLVVVLLPLTCMAKQADGVVVLEGTIQNAQTDSNALAFNFTGNFSFTFFNTTEDRPEHKRIEVTFAIVNVPVSIPMFGDHRYDQEDCPSRVTYKNAVQNAQSAARTAESVTVYLFEPTLSYDINGVLRALGSARGQVLLKSLIDHSGDRQSRCRKQ